MQLMRINSALVSGQNRDRFYCFNWNVEQPQDREIFLKDILESGEDLCGKEKSYCLTATYAGAAPWNTIERGQRSMVAEPVAIGFRNRREADGNLYRRPETSNSPKSNALTTVQTDSMVGIPINVRCTCAAEPVRIGTVENTANNKQSKQYRVYSPDGKSTTLCGQGGGMGAKTGLYATPTENKALPNIYHVEDGKIEIKGNYYPIKLADGDYIIRKLTPIECERLQTLPDNYTSAVSNSQRYKGLGNGWTAEVIIHILSGALANVPKDEEIVVLSMYDGIGTGRYCLDKMGFTNVKYYAYEIDKFAMKVAQTNYPDIVELGDAFDLRRPDWQIGKRFEEATK